MPKNSNTSDTENTTPNQRMTINRRSRRASLPVPNQGYGATFSIKGIWRDNSLDPDACSVVLKCHMPKVGRNSTHMLTRDIEFVLPFGTLQVDLETLNPADCTSLKVSIVARDCIGRDPLNGRHYGNGGGGAKRRNDVASAAVAG